MTGRSFSTERSEFQTAQASSELDQIVRRRTSRLITVEALAAAELDLRGNLAFETDSKPPVTPCLQLGRMTPPACPRPLRVTTVDGSFVPTQTTLPTRFAAGSDLAYIARHHAE